MKIEIKDHLREYAFNYYHKEIHEKGNKKPSVLRAWAAIEAGEDPVEWMRKSNDDGGFKYKLPLEKNDFVVVALLTLKEEVESLLIHDYMLDEVSEDGKWIRDRVKVPKPITRRLKNLTTLFVNQGYFENSKWKADRQYKNYHSWKQRDTLDGILRDREKPLIEYVGVGEYEIIDGWGRLLPFVALLEEFSLHPIEAFVAVPSLISSLNWQLEPP
jgi:hypothetical protein